MNVDSIIRKKLGIPLGATVYTSSKTSRSASFQWRIIEGLKSFEYSPFTLIDKPSWLLLDGDEICENIEKIKQNNHYLAHQTIAVLSTKNVTSIAHLVKTARTHNVDGILCDLWLDEINHFDSREDIRFFCERCLFLDGIKTRWVQPSTLEHGLNIQIFATNETISELKNSTHMLHLSASLPVGYNLEYVNFDQIHLFSEDALQIAKNSVLLSFVDDNDFNDYIYEISLTSHSKFKRFTIDSTRTSLFRKSYRMHEKFTLRGLAKLLGQDTKSLVKTDSRCSPNLDSAYQRVISDWNGYYYKRKPTCVSDNPMAMKFLTSLAKGNDERISQLVVGNLFDQNQSYFKFPGDVGVVWGNGISNSAIREQLSEGLLKWIKQSKPSPSWIECFLEFTVQNLYGKEPDEKGWTGLLQEPFRKQHDYLLEWIDKLICISPSYKESALFSRFLQLFYSGQRSVAFSLVEENPEAFAQSKIFQSLLFIYCFTDERDRAKSVYKTIYSINGQKAVSSVCCLLCLGAIFNVNQTDFKTLLENSMSSPFNPSEIEPLYLLCVLFGFHDIKNRILLKYPKRKAFAKKLESGLKDASCRFPFFDLRNDLHQFVSKRIELEICSYG